MIAASMPMIASTQRISISAKPATPRVRSARSADDVSCRATAALLAVRSERDDVIGSAFAGRAIDVAVAPGVVGHHAAAQIRPVPARRVVAAGQRGEPLVAVRIAA